MRELSGLPVPNTTDQGSETAIEPHAERSTALQSQVVMQSLLEQGRRRRERRLARLQVAVMAAEEFAELEESPVSTPGSAEITTEPPDARAFLQLFQEYERYV